MAKYSRSRLLRSGSWRLLPCWDQTAGGRRLLIRCLIGPRCHLWTLLLISNENDSILLATAQGCQELLTSDIGRRISLICGCRFPNFKVPLFKPCRCVSEHHACGFVGFVCTRVSKEAWEMDEGAFLGEEIPTSYYPDQLSFQHVPSLILQCMHMAR